MFGTIDSWLLYRLCGIHATDYTNASRTLLYNIFDRAGTTSCSTRSMCPPRCCRQSSVFRRLRETTALGGRIPVAGVGGDQQAALFGQAAFEPGWRRTPTAPARSS